MLFRSERRLRSREGEGSRVRETERDEEKERRLRSRDREGAIVRERRGI